MLSRKKINQENKERGERGEALTREHFGLAPTSSSGSGRFDKLDSKNEWIRCETKTTSKPSYSLKIEDFKRWKSQCARDGKQFFLHLVPEINGEVSWEFSLVVISDSYGEALGAYEGDKLCRSEHWNMAGATSINIGFDPDFYEIPEVKGFIPIALYTGEGYELVALPAPYFKELLEKNA
jgi:hypothetical protein